MSEKLDQMLLKHSHQFQTFESTLRTLTYILPGRFEDAEFVSEGLYACLNLVGMYYDNILAKKYPKLLTTQQTSPFNLYIRWLLQRSNPVNTVSHLLAITQHLQILVELTVRKFFGDEVHINFIMITELCKFVARMFVMHKGNYRMVLSTAVPERQHELVNSDLTGDHLEEEDGGLSQQQKLPSGDLDQYLVNKAMESKMRKPQNLVKSMTGESLAGEILYWVRPVLYAWLLKKYGTKSWKPWLTSLAVDSMAQCMIRGQLLQMLQRLPNVLKLLAATRFHASSSQMISRTKTFTMLERDELNKRLWLLLYYLLRNPIYSEFTKGQLEAICNTKIPIVSIFTGILHEYIPLWDKIYFYTSAS
ncbi:hypothetical protein MIR68_010447 [Amoeboaphelidium protococcarum]|nr:hypothetical protein MIR68_010447 [Amoeboaphelidium protococcarum]